MITVRRIAMLPVVLYVGAVYAAFGLIFGAFLLFNPFIVDASKTTTALGENLLRYCLMVLGIGIWGVILGAIAVVVYNRLARWTGGIRVELVSLESKTCDVAPAQPGANME